MVPLEQSPKSIVKGLEDLKIKGQRNISKIGLSTEKNPKDLRTLTVTPVKKKIC